MTANDNMIERVARAMQESPAWPAVFQSDTARLLARAALEAARGTTPVMNAAGASVSLDCRDCGDQQEVAGWVFTAMIDAALGESK